MTYLIAILTLIVVLYAFNKFTCFHCRSKVCLAGKTALITGGASGLGYQAALTLAARGCRVIIADILETSEAVQQIIKQSHNPNIIGKHLDLQSFKSVRQLAKNVIETESRLDILINNAGIGNLKISYTEDGLHRSMQVNYFSHFLLTHLLLDILKKSAPSRIIFTSSIVAYLSNLTIERLNPKPDYDKFIYLFRGGVYGDSKLCLAAAAKLFGEKLKGTGVTVNTFHPGAVRTRLFFRTLKEEFSVLGVFYSLLVLLFAKSPEDGAQTLLYLAQADDVKNVTGKYFMEGRQIFHPLQLRNEDLCQSIWDKSITYTKLQQHEIKC